MRPQIPREVPAVPWAAGLRAGVMWLSVGVLHVAPVEAATDGPELAQLEREPASARAEPGSDIDPVVTPPAPLITDVEYPPEGVGEARVILELLLSDTGVVLEARVIQGQEPFAGAALAAVGLWYFEPARRGDRARPARIGFAVDFVAPASEEQASSDEPQPSSPTKSAETKTTAEVLVLGEFSPRPEESLQRAEVRELPGAFGDPFRAIEVLPGVVPIVSGLPYFFVRGAPPGNVGYYFDGIPVPTLFHFAAGPAVLHPAFVESVDLYAGAYPAYYGRFAGGIVTGSLAPTTGDLRGQATVRLLDSGAMVEAPFADGRGSLLLGGRYSYTGAVISLVVPEVSLAYWDYQSQLRYQLDEDDTVEVFAFGSRDTFEQDIDQGEDGFFELGFHRVDLRWDHSLPKGRWRQALTWGFDRTSVEEALALQTVLLGARSEADWQLDSGDRVRVGVNLLTQAQEQFIRTDTEEFSEGPAASPPPSPNGSAMGSTAMDGTAMDGTAGGGTAPAPEVTRSDTNDELEEFGFGDRRDYTLGAYLEYLWHVSPRFDLVPGLRAELYASGSRTAWALEPRLTARTRLSARWSLVQRIGVAHQGPSFPVTIAGLTPSLKGGLQRALQSSAGVELGLTSGFKGSVTVFQNAFFNMTDLASTGEATDGSGFRSLGHAYGAELLVHRDLSKRLGGLLSYTLMRSSRSLGSFSGPAAFDRTHTINLALSYDLGANWRFGNRLLAYTGIPTSNNFDSGAPEWAPDRTPAFWRLDWRLEKRWSWSKAQYLALIFEVLNTTLNEEVTGVNCYEDAIEGNTCFEDRIGPITLPSIGLEGAF